MKEENIITLTKAHHNKAADYMNVEGAQTTPAERREMLNERREERNRLDAAFVEKVYNKQ